MEGYSHYVSVVFQQIEIEDSVNPQTGATTLRMFGVTEVRGVSTSHTRVLTCPHLSSPVGP